MTTHTPSPATVTGTPTVTSTGTPTVTSTGTSTDETLDIDRRREARQALRTRHSEQLNRLLEERADLAGVHSLADFVAESVRWTA